ncbi:MAG: hypothetical protein IJQ81_03590 [Oscillibacter sp.]|nr:hypothetical protein [Oscillibacter sp.]
MKGKKYLSLLLALVMTLALASCGGGQPASDAPANNDADADATVSEDGGYKTDSLVVNIWDNNQRARERAFEKGYRK